MSIVEKAARALAERRLAHDQERAVQGGCDIMLVIDGYMPDARRDVRIVLRAIREPTDEMIQSAYTPILSGDTPPPDYAWPLMIDAALAEDGATPDSDRSGA